ncbi:MAG: GatB/YqeY domain-containing protein [Candidatus Omnitrophota bacterium]
MLEGKILNDYKEAMKKRDVLKSSVISFLRAEMINLATAKKKSALDDTEVVSVIKKQIKQRKDSIEQFTKGKRIEMAEKEEKEMEVLKSYLPPELPYEEVLKIVVEVIAQTNASGIKDMGKVIKEVNARIGPQADGKVISDTVRERLASLSPSSD